MPTDLVFPQGNERKLAAMSRELGITRLLCCYPLAEPRLRSLKDELARLQGVEAVLAIIVERQEDVPKAQRITPEVVARGDWAFEDKRVRYVIGFEGGKREDFIHHRNSGLNQVFIQAGMRTGKTFLVDVSQLLTGEQHVVLGRVLQNNMFFRKYRPAVLVVSGAREALDMRAPRDMTDLLRL